MLLPCIEQRPTLVYACSQQDDVFIQSGNRGSSVSQARPCTLPELTALSKVPRFSKNKRKLYGQDIVMALQQVGPNSQKPPVTQG